MGTTVSRLNTIFSKFKTYIKSATAATVLLSLAACAGAKDGELPPAHLSEPVALTDQTYKIGPLDQLQIFVWRNPDLSATLMVRPDGRISMPLVADMKASGKTTVELAKDIETALAETIRSPIVTVVAVSFNGTYGQQVRILGEAVNPSALQYQANMTLMDVMIRVGGLTEFAAGNRARLVRFVDQQKKEYRVRLDDLVNDGDMNANVRLMPGDVIVIPGTFF